ncbi:MAG: orotidine-5'-phosphate decarboxylase [Acidimicrobiia bacterium]
MIPENPILVALDVESAEDAIRLAGRVGAQVGGFKIGLRLLSGPGPGVIGALARMDKPVLADAQLHDIPSQVEAAATRLGEFGARWVTAHAGGGRAMLEAAVSGLKLGAGDRPAGVLGVTVLTSLGLDDITEAGFAGSPGKLTSRLARLAQRAGCEGVVCSPRELGVVGEVAPDLLKVAAGIRPGGPTGDDQSRVATPAEALNWGADLLVIGRPIIAASDPGGAAADIWGQVRVARDPA